VGSRRSACAPGRWRCQSTQQRIIDFFDVASAASLTLKDMTLTNGLVVGGTGAEADGGAILVVAGASLTVRNSTFTANQTVGGDGSSGPGGSGYGGAGENQGTTNVDHDSFCGNQAMGGRFLQS